MGIKAIPRQVRLLYMAGHLVVLLLPIWLPKVPAKMLILETPFHNIRGAIQMNIPLLWLPFPIQYKFANDQHLQKVECPVYIFQGTNDWVVPYTSACLLKPYLSSADHFITIPKGAHKNLPTFEVYQKKLEEILEK